VELKMKNALIGVITIVLMVPQVATWAMAAQPADASDVTRVEFDAIVKQFPKGGDQQLRVVDTGKANVGIGIVRWAPGARGVLTHAQVTEVYYMLEGTGTLVTGGTMPDGKPMPSSGDTVRVLVGPSSSGETIQNGHSRKIGPGDVIVIPAGVPHQWATVDSDMKYMVVRVDPDKILPAGYVNPTLKK
jgi:mannose-6-phosphate isomerase-like protein (cupin superfamily)